jgi:hypothetical protein
MGGGTEDMATKRDPSLRSAVPPDLSESYLLQQLGWFRGLDDPRDTVLGFIEHESARRETQRRSQGASGEALSPEKIKERLIQSTTEYISLVIKTSGYTCDLASIEFAEEELRVIQVRTDLDFRNWLVKILFVIDADSETASAFRKVLNRIEYAVLTAERFTAELEYVNRRSDPVDSDSLRQKYPLVGRFKTKLSNTPG